MHATEKLPHVNEQPFDFSAAIYVAVGPGVWGRGPTLADARKQCRRAGLGADDRCIVYACEDSDAFCDQSGCLVTGAKTRYAVAARYEGRKQIRNCPSCGAVFEFSGRCPNAGRN